ncbi:MAG TPA: ATP-binding protein, partial [Clostridia bacterium]|nr:ATP-binding protein [Clostridia bacterium]
EAATAQRIADFLDQAISEARQLSRGLFPIRLEADGLPSAIEELARSTRERFQLDCHFECAERIVFKGKIVATHLYRIAQEAVNNAVKHARPKHITIRLICHPDTLELRVEDDGLGMTAEVSPGNSGMGLHIMHYRATSIGGTLHVVQNVHGGTLVSCCLPWEQS